MAEMTPIATPTIAQMMRGADREEQRPRQPLDELVPHRDPRVVGVAEPRPAVLVAGDEVLHEDPVLLVPGLVEPELLADLGDRLRRRRLAGEANRRIARGHDVEDEEGEHRHDQDDQTTQSSRLTM